MSERIRFDCPSCGEVQRVPAAAAGRRGKCGSCREVIRVPGEKVPRRGSAAPAAPEDDAAAPAGALVPRRGRGTGKRIVAPPRRGTAKRTPQIGKRRPGALAANSAKGPIAFTCSACAEEIEAPASAAGTQHRCEVCGERVRVPGRRARRAGGGGGPRLLAHERHLRGIAVWYRLSGALMIALAALTGLAGAAAVGQGGAGRGGAVVLVAAGLYGAIGAFTFFVGHSLWSFKNWARLLSLGLQGLSVLAQLVAVAADPGAESFAGALVSIALAIPYLWALAAAPAVTICSPRYQQVIREHPAQVRWWASPFFYLPAILLGLGLGCLLMALVAGAAAVA